MKYALNMIRSLREKEKKAERVRIRAFALSVLAGGLLALSFGYAALQMVSMRATLSEEEKRLERIEAEYRQYRETKEFVDKDDIELLDRLHNGKVFWTKKLVTLARYLPDNFWTTRLRYDGGTLDVEGFGYITQHQDQLVIIDDYLNRLRGDKAFMDIFQSIYLNSVTRTDQEGKQVVSFSFSVLGRGATR